MNTVAKCILINLKSNRNIYIIQCECRYFQSYLEYYYQHYLTFSRVFTSSSFASFSFLFSYLHRFPFPFSLPSSLSRHVCIYILMSTASSFHFPHIAWLPSSLPFDDKVTTHSLFYFWTFKLFFFFDFFFLFSVETFGDIKVSGVGWADVTSSSSSPDSTDTSVTPTGLSVPASTSTSTSTSCKMDSSQKSSGFSSNHIHTNAYPSCQWAWGRSFDCHRTQMVRFQENFSMKFLDEEHFSCCCCYHTKLFEIRKFRC